MNKQQVKDVNHRPKRSNDDVAYREFARKMAPRISLNNKSESVDVLIDTLKKSKYFDKL